MARRYNGPNWTFLKRACAFVALVAALYVAYPMFFCMADRLGAVDIGEFQTLDADRGFQSDATGNTAGFVSRLSGSVTGCFTLSAAQARPIEAQFTVLGGFVGWLLFTILGAIDARRRVRRAADQQRKARQGLQRERTSRTTTGSGHPTVRGSSTSSPRIATGSPRAATSSPAVVPRVMSSGALGSANGPLDDDDDVLARLDEQWERDSSSLHETAPGSGSRSAVGSSTSRQATSDPTHVARDSGATQAAPEPRATPGSPRQTSTTDDLPDLGDLGWDDGDDWSGDPISEAAPPVSPRRAAADDAAFDDTLAPGEADLASALATPAPRPSSGGRDAAARVRRVQPLEPMRLGADGRLALEADGLPADGGASVTVSVAVIAPDGELTACFTDRPLRDVGVRTGSDGMTLRLAWRDVALGVLEAARGIANGAVALRVALRDAHGENSCDLPLHDRLVVHVADQFGAVHGDVQLLVRDASGAAYAARPDTGGRFVLDGLVPGVIEVWRADQGILQTPGGALRTRLELATTGVAFALPSGSVDDDAHHEWVAWRANRHFVRPGAERGDGSGERPFGTMREALDAIADRRHGANHALDYDEIRIEASVSHPGQRVGALRSSDGSGPWWAWWSGKLADTKRPWFQGLAARDVQSRSEARLDGALREDFVVVAVDRLRIVGAQYAERFDALNEGRATLNGSLDALLESTPLTVIGRPATELAEPYRISVRSARHLFLGGLHLVGGRGQTGLDLREVQHAHVFRCWVDGFESGSTAHSGVVGVGRGIQIEGSGRGPASERVHLERCDVGYNRAQRRSMPIRGAGVAVYDSVVHLSACVLHNNTSTQDPAGLSKDGKSSVTGTGNHREANTAV